MKKKTIRLWIFILSLISIIVLLFFLSIGNKTTPSYIAKKSQFHFNKSLFNSFSIHKLHGEVDFYYDTLLTPSDFTQTDKLSPSGLIKIPGRWNAFKIDNREIKGHGKGTYHFTVIVPDTGWYGLKITEFKSAYNLWVNGNNLGGAGIVSSTKDEMQPSRKRNEFLFQTKSKQIEVILQVSNFHHYKGGATESIIFGTTQNILQYKKHKIGLEIFVLGLLFILFIYHLILYIYRREDKSILYFSLLCLTMLVRLGYIGEKILLDIFSFLPWEIAIRIEYISLYSIGYFVVLFARKLLPNEIHLWLVKLISILCTIYIAVVLFCSPNIFSYTPTIFIYSVGPAATYLLVMVFIAVIRGRKYSASIFIGYYVFFIFSLNDILNFKHIIDSAYLMPFGLLVVTFSQAYVLAKKMSDAYSRNKLLSDKLKKHASNLEETVKSRTQVVMNQKEEIEHQKNELQKKAKELKASNEQLISLAGFKKDMTNMMIHDFKTPLSNIIGFSSLPDSFEKHKDIIYTSAWDIQNLIQNILDVEKYDSLEMTLNLKKTQLHELVTKSSEVVKFMIFSNQIRFYNNISKKHFANIDSEVILRVFSNILSNATRYSEKDGIIKVSSEIITYNEKEFLKVNIYNSGEPIPAEKLNLIFQKYVQLDKFSIDIKYSTGIGLTFCKMAVEAHGGQIGVLSGKEKGVDFWFTLPI